MIRLGSSLMILLLGYSSALLAGDIILRTSVTPEQAWVGQRVLLYIDVLGADGWTKISKVGEIDVPGAYTIRTDSPGSRLQETIDGVSYTGQRYELSIYPQVAGALEVPPLDVELSTKGWGPDATDSIQQASTPAVSILAKIPPGADDVHGLISTTRLTAEQKWEPSIEAPKVGDAFKRRVILQADDVSGMAFVPLRYADIPGVGIYPAEPSVKDSSDRGSLTGTRTELVTYVLEHSGEVRIPDIVLVWWNITDSKLQRVELPGQLLNVAAGPAGATDAMGLSPVRQFGTRELWLAAILLLIFTSVLWRFRKGMVQRWAAWRKRRKESEERYFKLMLKSVRSNHADAALRDLMRWLDRINDDNRPARLETFLHQYGDARLQQATADLYLSLAAGDPIADVPALHGGLSAARSRWRQIRHPRQRRYNVLPELNRT